MPQPPHASGTGDSSAGVPARESSPDADGVAGEFAPALAHRIRQAARLTAQVLLQARVPEGHWKGELSSSALSTATALTALRVLEQAQGLPDPRFTQALTSGFEWLRRHANPDGGWGDTLRSRSNLSTTTLCWAALGLVPAAAAAGVADAVTRAEQWLTREAGGIHPDQLALAVIARYGKDRTFSIPILTLCAMAGRLGPGREAWRHVIPLPFELAACPHSWFAALRLPVVSYALPALIAIGQARHHHRPSRNPFARLLRTLTRQPTLARLTHLQPANGGFLEATPLTSFVTLSLAGSGQHRHPVVAKGVEFLLRSRRPDGSWPIDTNLSTWVTTLAINALAEQGRAAEAGQREPGAGATLRDWLLGQQYRAVHPYTRAAPGGWAWTDLPGGVPDADDTAGALVALRHLAQGRRDAALPSAVEEACRWLLELQNRDGGIPTFCRGWGNLPFDRSSPDITAHGVRAWLAWRQDLPTPLQARAERGLQRAIDFLAAAQAKDGSWAPLWFGNQHVPDETNRTYGTARVLSALTEAAAASELPAIAARARALAGPAVHWLLSTQNPDGSWGGGAGDGTPSIEETALALEALAAVWRQHLGDPIRSGRGRESVSIAALRPGLQRGAEWLVARVESGTWREPSPIGFYFARLWYYEALYPVIFTTGALRQLADRPMGQVPS